MNNLISKELIIDKIDPLIASIGEEVKITITGNRFGKNSIVIIGNIQVTKYEKNENNEIICWTPSFEEEGFYDVIVKNEFGFCSVKKEAFAVI